MKGELKDILLDLRSHLKHQKSRGILYLPKETTNPISSPAKAGPKGERATQLAKLMQEMVGCTRCRLSSGRTNLVFGVGNPNAHLMFVGEGPGFEEDQQGLPFVGRAGILLTKIIEAMGVGRDDVYIANVVKCRPPENRNPYPDETKVCSPFLFRQIEIIQPKIIVCLGTFAAQVILNTDEKISRLRGKIFDLGNIKVIATYHPAFLLRNPNMKRPVWNDMKKVMELLK